MFIYLDHFVYLFVCLRDNSKTFVDGLGWNFRICSYWVLELFKFLAPTLTGRGLLRGKFFGRWFGNGWHCSRATIL